MEVGFIAESKADVERVLAVLMCRVFSEAGRQLDWCTLEFLLDRVFDAHADRFIKIHEAIKRCRERNLRIHGLRGKLGMRSARAALVWFKDVNKELEVVVLATDVDGDDDRENAVDLSRTGSKWPFAVVLALPKPEVEAWKIAGFQPRTGEEANVLERLREELGFDPTRYPERLTSTKTDSPKDAKRVIERLAPSLERQAECLDLPLEQLADKGAGCGLAQYLGELRTIAVPVLAGTNVVEAPNY